MRSADPRLYEASIHRSGGRIGFERATRQGHRSPSPSSTAFDTRESQRETLDRTLDTAIGCRRPRRGWAQVGHQVRRGDPGCDWQQGKADGGRGRPSSRAIHRLACSSAPFQPRGKTLSDRSDIHPRLILPSNRSSSNAHRETPSQR